VAAGEVTLAGESAATPEAQQAALSTVAAGPAFIASVTAAAMPLLEPASLKIEAEPEATEAEPAATEAEPAAHRTPSTKVTNPTA
jgi:hypothetical protein